MSGQAGATLPPLASAPTAAPAVTPTLRTMGKRAAFWVIAGVGMLLVALITMMLTNAGMTGGAALGRDNAAPGGGMAVAEVLSANGVTVITANTLDGALDETSAAQSADASATLLVYDAESILTAEQIARLDGAAHHTVIIDPDFGMLQTLAPDVGFGGTSAADEELHAGRGCTSTAAERAGSVTGLDGNGLKTLSVPADAPGFTACFRAQANGDAESPQSVLVQEDAASGQLSLVADPAIFANESITAAGNAALALGLLGEHPTLVWYLPTLADVVASGPPSLAELSPGWVTPVMVLLVLCGVAAAIAYGRRFGPLVVENLPVTVRASETMEGRARLYARSSARLRALDALRIATVSRLATRLGLSRTASLAEIVSATASVTAQNPSVVRAVLVDDTPRTDADLIAASDRLLELERLVEARTRPGGAPGATPLHPSNERMEP